MKQRSLKLGMVCFVFSLINFYGLPSIASSSALQTPTPSSHSQQSSAEPDLLKLRVTVFDQAGHIIPGLSKDDFSATIDKSSQPISYFSDDEEPVSIVFLVDLSGSMQTGNSKVSRFSFLAQAVQRFIQFSNVARNEFSIISFSREPRLVLNWTQNPQDVVQAFANLAAEKAKGNTALRNACQAGLEQAQTGTYTKRAVIVFSDGQEYSDTDISENDLKILIQKTDALIYAVNLGTVVFTNNDRPGIFSNPIAEIGNDFLDSITSRSGGKAYHPQRVAGIQQALDLIATQLQHQYYIGLKPGPSATRGKLLKVKVKLSSQTETKYGLKGLIVWHREEIYNDLGRQSTDKSK
jgi:VWFA-related protein